MCVRHLLILKNVNTVAHKIAIIYLSYGGNTRDLASYIARFMEEDGHLVHLFNHKDMPVLADYDYILFGSLTWDEGKLPSQMRRYFKKMLKDNPEDFTRCSVFGTGETQWGNFCRAVDEMAYHLNKHEKAVDFQLKIEQNPIGKETRIKEFTKKILEVI